MNPLGFTISGSHGISCGLGLDTLTVVLTESASDMVIAALKGDDQKKRPDFGRYLFVESNIPNDALAVAIRGDNGTGKSTIINLAMVPWREPTQVISAGKGGRQPRDIYDQFGDTGLRILPWEHGGKTYRSRIEYRNTGKTKAQKAYLHVQNGLNWDPVSLPDNTTSDGKASTYDACLSHILGDQSIYYLSAFRAQGAPKLAEYDDPKGLMRALLGLDEPARLAEQARLVAKGLRVALEGTRGTIAELAGYPEKIADLERSAMDFEVQRVFFAAKKVEEINVFSRAQAELDRAVSGDIDRQRLVEQRAVVQARLAVVKVRLSGIEAGGNSRVRAAEQRIAAAEQAHAAHIEQLDRDLAAARARVTSAEQILAERDAIDAAQAEVESLTAQLSERERAVADLTADVDQLRELAGKVRTLETEQNAVKRRGAACKDRLDDLIRRAGYVEQVTCKGKGEFAECVALQDAIAARGKIPEAEKERERELAEWKRIGDDLLALSSQVDGYGPAMELRNAAQRVLTDLRSKLESVRTKAAKASAIEVAERNRAEAAADVAALGGRIDAAAAEHAKAFGKLNEDLDEITKEAAQEYGRAIKDVDAVTAQLCAIHEPGTDQAVDLARTKLALADAAVAAAQEAHDTASASKASATAKAQELRQALADGAEIIAKAKRLEDEIATWTLLSEGLKGVIYLSIEDAGPAIAATANSLLTEAYGPRFTVRIVTQRQQANGRIVEDFDISVIDGWRNKESSILMKSKGESVWMDKALTDAVAIHHQDVAGVHFGTVFADEVEDGLTAERKLRFYAMDRAALALGGHKRKYFISHNPEAWEMADHVIDLDAMRVAA
jgi:DNA repair protein SbcC/Rad50